MFMTVTREENKTLMCCSADYSLISDEYRKEWIVQIGRSTAVRVGLLEEKTGKIYTSNPF